MWNKGMAVWSFGAGALVGASLYRYAFVSLRTPRIILVTLSHTHNRTHLSNPASQLVAISILLPPPPEPITTPMEHLQIPPYPSRKAIGRHQPRITSPLTLIPQIKLPPLPLFQPMNSQPPVPQTQHYRPGHRTPAYRVAGRRGRDDGNGLASAAPADYDAAPGERDRFVPVAVARESAANRGAVEAFGEFCAEFGVDGVGGVDDGSPCFVDLGGEEEVVGWDAEEDGFEELVGGEDFL